MDTPDKNRIAAVSLCNFEESPVFKYINDLSPIEPVKSVHTDHILNSLALASPSSLFSSPLVNSNRESRFSIKRHQSPDQPNPGFLVGGNVNNSRDSLECMKGTSLSDEQLKCVTPKPLDKDAETKPFTEQFGLASELAKALKNASDGCDIQMISCDKISADSENTTARVGSAVQRDEDLLNLKQANDPFKFDLDLHPICQIEKNKADDGSGAAQLISDVASVLGSERPNQEMADPGTNSFTSSPQHLQLDGHNSENVEPGDSLSSGVQSVTGTRDITLRGSCEVTTNDLNAKTEGNEERCIQPTRKQRSIRRRCLIFDVGGSHRKKPLHDSTNSHPTTLPSVINKVPSPGKQLVPVKKDTDNALSMPRTIGLHLNDLVNSSSHGIKLISKPGQLLSHGPMMIPQNFDEELSTPVSMKRDLVSCENEVMEEASGMSTDGECLENDKATGKRHWSEGLGESGSCKRCKCKRSKCLKLYCDCFAAGLYCIEPCSCQDCFNKPIHEDIVMDTRRQIEARNPLAFAPKVVTAIDSTSDSGDDKNKTPASARHKRGCNCKRSGCLKKYCECFLMGVGCSPSCRCMGCRNSFGQKDETDAIMISEEERNQDGKRENASESSTHDSDGDVEMMSDPLFQEPPIPLRSLPASAQPYTFPRFESHLQMIPEEEENPEIPDSNRVLLLRSIPPFPSLRSP